MKIYKIEVWGHDILTGEYAHVRIERVAVAPSGSRIFSAFDMKARKHIDLVLFVRHWITYEPMFLFEVERKDISILLEQVGIVWH